jgi:hypothetical protein
MEERYNPEEEEDFGALSKEVEKCWRIIYHPFDYSDDEIDGAFDFLESCSERLFAQLTDNSPIEKQEIVEEIMAGLFHYRGKVLPSGETDDVLLTVLGQRLFDLFLYPPDYFQNLNY